RSSIDMLLSSFPSSCPSALPPSTRGSRYGRLPSSSKAHSRHRSNWAVLENDSGPDRFLFGRHPGSAGRAETVFCLALASWCARTGGRRPFFGGRNRPSLLMVAHQLASASEVTSS